MRHLVNLYYFGDITLIGVMSPIFIAFAVFFLFFLVNMNE